ncbi:YD repeat-containing protein [Flavobacterium sp. 28YEA47A]|uniref:hypothetical protein n=1 Tax=Flavobacterium sp. 28YEA47A TaxID=3156276 RepID=UPI0035173871
MKKIYALLVLLTASPFAMAQVSSATEYGPQTVANTAAAMFRFDDLPVSLHTGIPDISIPLLSLPTRSKDISLNLAMAYHPSSISIGGVVNDDIRQPGWSIGRGGTITKTVEDAWFNYKNEQSNPNDDTRYFSDRYQFSFMGHSGIFYVIKTANNELVPSLFSGKGETLKVTLDYDPVNFKINSFIIFDSREYKYVFDIVDRDVEVANNVYVKNTPKGYSLSAIYDKNGNKLLSFAYLEMKTPLAIQKQSIVNKLTSIQAEGFGKVQFAYSTGNNTVYDPSRELMLINEMTLTDPNSNTVKRIDLRQWDRLTFRDAAQAKGEEYRFSYSDGTYGYEYEALDGRLGNDRFGYPTFIPSEMYEYSQQLTDYAVNPKFCTRNVLEKILLPTGGSILYEYESNTYSYFQGVSISENYVPGTGYVEEPESYYTYYVGEAVYPYNHIVEELYRGRIPNSSGFAISGTAPMEVCIFIKPYEYFSDLSNTWVEPTVTMNGFPPSNTSVAFQNTHNSENFGYGRSYILPPSRYYFIQLGDVSQNHIPKSAYRVIRSIRKNPDIKKWKYGGGIRIKRIAHFNEDVPADLFRGKDQMQYPEYTPVKETYYSYSLFGEPNRSSGNLVADNGRDFQKKYGHLEFVSYRNVTVTDSGNNGKTEYTFTTSADYPALGLDTGSYMSLSQDFRRGLLKNRKDYDRNNVLVKNTDYTYRFYDAARWQSYYMDRSVVDRTAKVRTASETETLYQPGSAPIVQQTGFAYHRDANRALESKQTTASEGETLKTAYTYLTRNAPLAEQRFSEIEKTENYKNGNLVATAKTDYSNTWPGNVSWMPATISTSTTNKTLAVKAKFNRYDEFGNILEIEQPNGMKTSYVWGYNNTQMVAKIENMAYGSIPQSLIGAVQGYSDSATYNEASLLSALEDLRITATASGAMMTGYSYKPLVGVSATIDPKGKRTYYQYDSFGRPKSVKDKDGNTLTENQYNYRP